MTVLDERPRALWARIGGFRGWAARHEQLAVGVAVGFAVLVGSALALHAGSVLKVADEQQYDAIARNLADHGRYSIDGVTPTAYRPPVWPVVLAAVHVLGLGVVAARLINVLCLAGTVVGVWRLARRIGGPGAGVLAAAVCAVYPTFLYASATLYPQSLGTLLLVGAVLAAVNAADAFDAGPGGRANGSADNGADANTNADSPAGNRRRRALRLAALAGLLSGLLVLTVPVFSGTAALLVVWFFFALRRRALPLVAIAVGAALLFPAAWMVRNEAQIHAFIPVSSSDGVNLLLGNSEHAGPGTGTLADISKYDAVVRQRGLGEVGQDTYYRSAAVTWISHHPGDALVLFAEKTVHYFAFRDQLAGSSQPSSLQGIVLGVSFLPVLALLAVRLARARRRPLTRDEVLYLGLFVLSALVMAVFFTRVRFRLPLDALAIAVAAAALLDLVDTVNLVNRSEDV